MNWGLYGYEDEEEDALEELNEKLDVFFEKAKDAPRQPPCHHDWVNMGFTSLKLVCKKCDKEKKRGD